MNFKDVSTEELRTRYYGHLDSAYVYRRKSDQLQAERQMRLAEKIRREIERRGKKG